MTVIQTLSVRQVKNGLARARFFTRMHNEFVVQIKTKQRRGQAWMNALAVQAPYLYLEILNTEADCFYDDSRIAAFNEKVFEERMK